MPSFPVSIAVLSLFQAVLVALPRYRVAFAWMPRSVWWALVPAGSIVVVVFGIEAAPGSADMLTWLALLGVPPLAAAALGWLVHGTSPAWALGAVPLFLLAWAERGTLLGEAAGTLLTGLSCIALGWLLVSVVSARWLRWGIYAMAAIDAVLIGADLLQGPSGLLSAADPGGMPRLQVLEFGSARMGFGDAFVAATAGCLLAIPNTSIAAGPNPSSGRTESAHDEAPGRGEWLGGGTLSTRQRQLLGAALVAGLGLSFDLLFFALDTLPATVPVALALALVERLAPQQRTTSDPV